MAIDRRGIVLGAFALAGLPRVAASGSGIDVIAAWQQRDEHFVGRLRCAARAVRVLWQTALPGRAHGLAVDAGNVLVAARRPGDWLARVDARDGGLQRLHWLSGDTTLNGHLLRDGPRLLCSETDAESGAGMIAVRDAATFELRQRWPSGGRDPHQLLLGADGTLWVANGGIELRRETGRRRWHVERMDSSLVRVAAADGAQLGQWRLADPQLGLRHLAMAHDGTLGIALQAGHERADERSAAPLLALWDAARGLHAVPWRDGEAGTRSGYGGDIAAAAGGFVVSSPRDGRLWRWRCERGAATLVHTATLAGACALASHAGQLVAAGAAALSVGGSMLLLPAGMQPDNHVTLVSG